MGKEVGLLRRAELLARAPIMAEDLILESRQSAHEELPDVPGNVATLNTALKFERRKGSPAISPSTGRVIPGREESHTLTLERVPTGIHGLDTHVGGGFVRNSVNLITGSPGSGKTIFAVQFLMSGIQHNEHALFISFEERRENFFRYLRPFGWDLNRLEAEGKLTFLRFSPEHVHDFLDKNLEAMLKERGVKRVVIDSLTAFALLARDELSARESLVALFDRIRAWNATTLVVAEHEPHPSREPGLVEFATDSIIALYSFRNRNVRQRVAEIIKMRGTKVTGHVFPMRIGEDGITVYPDDAHL